MDRLVEVVGDADQHRCHQEQGDRDDLKRGVAARLPGAKVARWQGGKPNGTTPTDCRTTRGPEQLRDGEQAHLTRPTCTDRQPTIGLTLDTQLAPGREPMALAAQMVMTLTAKASSAAAALARRSATPGAAPRRSR